jgi:hypothetical protein
MCVCRTRPALGMPLLSIGIFTEQARSPNIHGQRLNTSLVVTICRSLRARPLEMEGNESQPTSVSAISTREISKTRPFPASGWFASNLTLDSFTSVTSTTIVRPSGFSS